MNRKMCLKCSYDEPSALQSVTLCAECLRQLREKSIVEQHHVLGRAVSDDTVPVPANLHAFLSARQREYPAAIRQPDHPLLYIALVLQSAGDFAAWMSMMLPHIANWLIALHSWLAEHYGEDWLEGNDLYPLERHDE
jgi:hypothetical protein